MANRQSTDQDPRDDLRIRILIVGVIAVITTLAVALQDVLPSRARALMGSSVSSVLSRAARLISWRSTWRTVGWGLVLQVTLAVFILRFEVDGVRPGYQLFSGLAAVVTQFLEFTNAGSQFVFGVLVSPAEMGTACSLRG